MDERTVQANHLSLFIIILFFLLDLLLLSHIISTLTRLSSCSRHPPPYRHRSPLFFCSDQLHGVTLTRLPATHKDCCIAPIPSIHANPWPHGLMTATGVCDSAVFSLALCTVASLRRLASLLALHGPRGFVRRGKPHTEKSS
jgi:hypothetical protein